MATERTIRIASRTSQLALWQTNAVKTKLEGAGFQCTIIPIESTGDIQLNKPIYELGVTGVFTKQLDIALLNNEADIAVHSLKDVPTQLAENLMLVAVLERGAREDVVLIKNTKILDDLNSVATVATSSLRRKAQWLSKYPKHNIVPVRGNVQTRLRKLEESANIDAMIFARAGLERLRLLPETAVVPDWMLPAPAQGIIGIVCRKDDEQMKEACATINHQQSFIEGSIERQFLRTLMGGCSVPISGLAEVNNHEVEFRGAVHTYDGQQAFTVHRVMLLEEWQNAGREAAIKILMQQGAGDLIEEIRNKSTNDTGTFN